MVLEIGDSLGNDLGWGLNREIGSNPGLTLIQMDKSDTGLSNNWYYNWSDHLATYLHEYHPHLVIIFLGGNDEQGMMYHGRAAAFGSSQWHAAYLEQAKSLASLAHRAGSYLLWVGMPVMQPPQYRQGMVLLNSLFEEAATSVPGGTFLPSWSVLAGSGGTFLHAGYVNRTYQVLRSPDGIHLQVAGENVLATYVARSLSAIYHVPLRLSVPAQLD